MSKKFEHIGICREIAWAFAKTTDNDFKDLLQEASVAYCKAMTTYNPEKGALTTHTWFCVQSHLINLIKKQKREIPFVHSDLVEEIWFKAPSKNNYFEQLTEDAFEVAQVVLASPGAFVCRTLDEVIDRLKAIMEQRGWPRSKTMKAIKELQFVYSNN